MTRVARLVLAVMPLVLTATARSDDAPVPHRVYQRGADGEAEIALGQGGANVRLLDADGKPIEGIRAADGKLNGVPTGGPYTIEAGETKLGPVFVGDTVRIRSWNE